VVNGEGGDAKSVEFNPKQERYRDGDGRNSRIVAEHRGRKGLSGFDLAWRKGDLEQRHERRRAGGRMH